MIAVDSSQIKEIGHAGDKLRVTFHGRGGPGKTAEYTGVDREVFEQLTEGVSVGKAFNSLIRDNYQFEYV